MTAGSQSAALVAVDVGNSRIKLGLFAAPGDCVAKAQSGHLPIASPEFPAPDVSLELPLVDSKGDFDRQALAQWQVEHIPPNAGWVVASVHRGAADALRESVMATSGPSATKAFHLLTHTDFDIRTEVPAPERVGVDRLAAAVAANRLRTADRPAIVVDHGSAITVDLLNSQGAFCGGAILPGVAMSARALADRTDALPLVAFDFGASAPRPVGESTEDAIKSGLWWGTVGAVRELVVQIAADQTKPPQVFVTGGGAEHLADRLAVGTELAVRHVPQLVLSGIALAGKKLLAKC